MDEKEQLLMEGRGSRIAIDIEMRRNPHDGVWEKDGEFEYVAEYVGDGVYVPDAVVVLLWVLVTVAVAEGVSVTARQNGWKQSRRSIRAHNLKGKLPR